MIIQGITIKKTVASDFEKIYPLLVDFDSPYMRDDWKRIFYYQWDSAEDHVGYHLEKNTEIIGFMGLIFSCRNKNEVCYQFCNITSLIVKSEYRAATILLLRKLMGYPNTIFTGLGPIEESFRLLTLMGFVPFEDHYKIIPVINGLFFRKKNILVDESENAFHKLDAKNKRIFLDHLHLKCKCIVFSYKNENHLFIYGVTIQKHHHRSINKIHVHYVSDLTFLNKNIHEILNIFRSRVGFFSALYIDKRLISDKVYVFSLNKKISPPRIRNKNFIDKIEIDSLYSEKLLL